MHAKWVKTQIERLANIIKAFIALAYLCGVCFWPEAKYITQQKLHGHCKIKEIKWIKSFRGATVHQSA